MAYKIIVPKAGTANKEGTESRLYTLDEVVETTAQWQKDLMEVFVANGWAVETKVESTANVEQATPVKTTKKTRRKKTTK